jgi:hypothetical protein
MNKEAPFANAASQLRLLIGKCDLSELAKNTSIPEEKLKDALVGKVGLESVEIDKLTSSTSRAFALKSATATDRRHITNKSASS